MLSGGLFIFTVRCETFDPEGHNYGATCKKLEESRKWKLIQKEKREQHSTPNEERFRYSYIITYNSGVDPSSSSIFLSDPLTSY